jgi:hypothetical protein
MRRAKRGQFRRIELIRMAEKSLLLQIPRPYLEGPSAAARSSAAGHSSARPMAQRDPLNEYKKRGVHPL